MRNLAEVEITGADLTGTLKALGAGAIPLENIIPTGPLTMTVTVPKSALEPLNALCRRRGDRVRLLQKSGPCWYLAAFLHRPLLVLGLALILGLTLLLPTRVLFITVEGNRTVPAGRILEAAEAAGVRFWASCRKLRSEEIKNALLEACPELQWAGLNIRGCTAALSVREGPVPPAAPVPAGITSLVAAADGIVESCTATRGTLKVRPGQAVEKGQLLISGYTDCGRILRAGEAEGTVFARTRRTYAAVTPDVSLEILENTGTRRVFTLILGKNRIKFGPDSGIRGPTCGRMYEEYYITLPGGFQLPIGLAVDRYVLRKTRSRPLTDRQGAQLLAPFPQARLADQMIAGRILAARQTVTRENGVFRLTGTYLCHEMIGRVRQEQIGE